MPDAELGIVECEDVEDKKQLRHSVYKVSKSLKTVG